MPYKIWQLSTFLSGLLLRNAMVDFAVDYWRSDRKAERWQLACTLVPVALSVIQSTHRLMARQQPQTLSLQQSLLSSVAIVGTFKPVTAFRSTQLYRRDFENGYNS